jgi:hypothetical protein
MIRVARAYNLAMNLHTLRMIRATLLYDTLVLRLDGTINRYAEYARFMDDRARFARKRWLRRIDDNSGDNFFVRVEELAETAQGVFRRAQHVVSSPVLHFASVVDKWAFGLSVLARMVVRLCFFTLVCAIGLSLTRLIQGQPTDTLLTFQLVFQHWFYQSVALIILILNVRHILFRLREREPQT